MSDSQEISAGWDTLQRQSKEQAIDYLHTARNALDKTGMKYTATDVIALAAIMQRDWHTSNIGVGLQKLAESVERVGQAIEDAFYKNPFEEK